MVPPCSSSSSSLLTNSSVRGNVAGFSRRVSSSSFPLLPSSSDISISSFGGERVLGKMLLTALSEGPLRIKMKRSRRKAFSLLPSSSSLLSIPSSSSFHKFPRSFFSQSYQTHPSRLLSSLSSSSLPTSSSASLSRSSLLTTRFPQSLSSSSSSPLYFLCVLPTRRYLSLFAPSSLRKKSSSSRLSLRDFHQIEQEAELHRHDPYMQQKYLSCLNANGDYAKVIQRFEENRFSSKPFSINDECITEYIKALSYTGQIHSRDLHHLTQVILQYSNPSSSSSSTSDRRRPTPLQEGEGQQEEEGLRQYGRNLSSSSMPSSSSGASSLLGMQQALQTQQIILSQQVNDILRHLLQKDTAGGNGSSARGLDGRRGGGESVKILNGSVRKGSREEDPEEDQEEEEKRKRGFARKVFGSVWLGFKMIGRGVYVTVKTCVRGAWSLLLSPIMAVFVLWSLVTDGFESFQQSAKRLEGNLSPDQKSKEWIATKVIQPSEVKTTFNDVKGCEEVKKEVQEVVAYLRSPEKFLAMGAHLPKGVLLQGPPGTGKTLLARAIAGEAGVPFLHASGSEFEEMYVGVGASRLRQLFAEARRMSPCILFIDEIDALGGRRTLTENKHHRQTLNQLLTELDGFKPSDGVTLICATNLAEALDPALTRPGRIDRIIHVPFPSKKERIEILQHYSANMPLASDVDLDTLACLTSGMTGADLANLLNFAAIRAATEGKEQVTLSEVEESFDRLMVGNRRTGVIMKEEERRLTAYHESGHALLALYTPHSLPLHKATILFRGSSLGVTWSVGKEDSYSTSQQQYLASLDVAMGGKAAEELIFGEGNVTSGCHSDLVRATQLARRMVMDYGMGVEDTQVPMVIGKKEYDVVSEGVKQKVDRAVQRLLDESYLRAKNLLQDKQEELQRLAEALLEHETLSAEEIREAVAGKLKREKPSKTRREVVENGQRGFGDAEDLLPGENDHNEENREGEGVGRATASSSSIAIGGVGGGHHPSSTGRSYANRSEDEKRVRTTLSSSSSASSSASHCRISESVSDAINSGSPAEGLDFKEEEEDLSSSLFSPRISSASSSSSFSEIEKVDPCEDVSSHPSKSRREEEEANPSSSSKKAVYVAGEVQETRRKDGVEGMSRGKGGEEEDDGGVSHRQYHGERGDSDVVTPERDERERSSSTKERRNSNDN
ncbi:atp-dependent metallopeptidase subfamily protein [Cystoisospora suis]|uniref:Atp-dependent metallopeptidase subfamily protein n=1 Tax=Cystoisospora suis TaxID=483139 RepID=A0A2C6KKT4_9APIC|nr:atp-dependent metallopeptidase subfamily protein [Cystoisospora suis]